MTPTSPLLGRLFLGALLVASLVGPLEAQVAEARSADPGVRAPGSVTGTGPGGATIRCRDGSHPAPMAADVACDGKGGVLLRYPLRRTAAPSATPSLIAAPTAPAIPTPKPPARVRPAGDGVVTTPRPPADATLLCTDGTFIKSDTSSIACGTHGGVRLRFLKRGTN